VEERIKNIFAEVNSPWSKKHLALEMLTSRTAHAERERERYTYKIRSRQSLSN
jgi:hypothetical protein